MTDLRNAIRRDMDAAGLPATTFENLAGRRDQRRRSTRISAAIVGAVFTIVAAWMGSSLLRSQGATEPVPTAPSPVATNGPMTWATEDSILMEGVDPSTPVVLASDVAQPGWQVGAFDWSPDGTRIVIATVRPLPRSLIPCRLVVLDVDAGSLTDLADCEHPGWATQMADWSPDGRSIVYAGPGGIYVIRADGSDPIQLTSDGGADPSWSPGGSIAYVSSDRQRLLTMSSDASDAAVLLARGSWNFGEYSPDGILSPAWSPDGRRIAFLQGEDLPGDPAGSALGSGLWIADADGSNAVKVATMECCLGAVESFGWSPDGSELVWTGTAVMFIEADGSGVTTFREGDGAGLRRLSMSVRPSWRPVA